MRAARAAARRGDIALVRTEAAAIPDRAGPEKSDDSSDAAGRMMRIAHAVLDGRAAMMDGKPAVALVAFRKGARMQETKGFLGYSDPPAFWYPVRRDVAAALLALGRPEDALKETDATLKLMPKDPVTPGDPQPDGSAARPVAIGRSRPARRDSRMARQSCTSIGTGRPDTHRRSITSICARSAEATPYLAYQPARNASTFRRKMAG